MGQTEQTVHLLLALQAQQVPAPPVPREFRGNPEARDRSVQPEKQGQVGVAVPPVQPGPRVRLEPMVPQDLPEQPGQQVWLVLRVVPGTWDLPEQQVQLAHLVRQV
jgi:hypothetical protein